MSRTSTSLLNSIERLTKRNKSQRRDSRATSVPRKLAELGSGLRRSSNETVPRVLNIGARCSQFENEFTRGHGAPRNRSTFDTTRFSAKRTGSTYQVVEGSRRRVPRVRVPLVHSHLFSLFFSIALAEQNYLLPRGYRDRARRENGFSHFAIMQIFLGREGSQVAPRILLYFDILFCARTLFSLYFEPFCR